MPQRRPRRCSQCKRIRCHKGLATCILNRNIDIDRMSRGLPPVFESNRRHVLVTYSVDHDDDASTMDPPVGVKLGSDYIKEISIVMDGTPSEPEQCGICYDNRCTITSNCGHQYCRVCIQRQFVAIQHKSKGMDCAFCRAGVTQLNTVDESTHGILNAFIQNVF